MAEAEDIVGFWCDHVGPEGWYSGDPGLDAEIARRFAPACEAAAARRLMGWLAAPRPALGLLILLDQFPRNVYRETPRAFAADPMARAVAKRAIALGHDRAVEGPERQFFYLPLMHSESLADQDRCMRLAVLRMAGRARADMVEHGAKHRAVIRRFGRFPSRNAALGRRDTAEERAYRAAGGYMG